jgi:hypothetical protein
MKKFHIKYKDQNNIIQEAKVLFGKNYDDFKRMIGYYKESANIKIGDIIFCRSYGIA